LRTLGLTIALLIAVGCASPAPQPTNPAVPASAATDPAGVEPGRPIAGTQDGLTVGAVFNRGSVEPGGTITIDVTVRNDRSTPAIVAIGTCGAPATLYADVAVPWEPQGRTWDGIAGEFKQYALTQGFGGGGVPANQALRVEPKGQSCPVDPGEVRLLPGETNSKRLTWTAAIVDGVPALPGPIPMHLGLSYDRPDPLPTPDCNPFCGMRMIPWKSLSADGAIRVDGNGPRIVTAGEALDAMLSDPQFEAWLPLQPSRTWSNANLFLQSMPSGAGIVPAGATWEIDLFREVGVPRNWAIGFVDAFTGELRNLAFCNNPCDR